MKELGEHKGRTKESSFAAKVIGISNYLLASPVLLWIVIVAKTSFGFDQPHDFLILTFSRVSLLSFIIAPPVIIGGLLYVMLRARIFRHESSKRRAYRLIIISAILTTMNILMLLRSG